MIQGQSVKFKLLKESILTEKRLKISSGSGNCVSNLILSIINFVLLCNGYLYLSALSH